MLKNKYYFVCYINFLFLTLRQKGKVSSFTSYHGTNKTDATAIIKDGFKLSLGDTHWLGDGVYTFMDGISDPIEDAKKWTEFVCWDNKRRIQKFQYGAIIKLTLKDDEEGILNLNTKEGMDVLKYIKSKCDDKLKEVGKAIHYIDGFLINFGRNEININIPIVIGRTYVKLGLKDRLLDLRQHVPNCTMCCIYDTSWIVDKEIIKDWRIEL